MLAFVSLGAQETAPKKTDPYNWYFYVAGGGGKATSFGVNAVTAGGQTGFEYRPNPYLGFELEPAIGRLKQKQIIKKTYS